MDGFQRKRAQLQIVIAQSQVRYKHKILQRYEQKTSINICEMLLS